jgi:multicomponent Na+:H+ antiporter subunit E
MNQGRSSFPSRNRGLFLQGLLLAAVWLVVSGKLEAVYLFWGAVSTGLVLWFSHRLRRIPVSNEATETEVYPHISVSRLLLYLVWLLWQMIKSGVYVAYLILHPKLRIKPEVVRFTSRQPNVIARVILGNSITLTPGTLTLAISGDRFVVHALTRDTGDTLINGEMGAKVCRLYSRGSGDQARCSEFSMEEVTR